MTAAGAITVSPDRAPGARRVGEIRETIRSTGVRCVFAEAQFVSPLVETIVEETGAVIGRLDPLGAAFEPGTDSYFSMMEANAAALVDCLGGP